MSIIKPFHHTSALIIMLMIMPIALSFPDTGSLLDYISFESMLNKTDVLNAQLFNSQTSNTTGVRGSAKLYDSDNDYLQLSANVWQNISAGTLCVWMNATVNTDNDFIYSFNNTNEYYQLSLLGGVGTRIRYDGVNHDFADVPSLNTWTFYCMRIQPEKTDFFKNGIQVMTSGDWMPFDFKQFAFNIGVYSSTGTLAFRGGIDELSIWTKNLTDAEILDMNGTFYTPNVTYTTQGFLFNSSFSDLLIMPFKPKVYEKFYLGANFTMSGDFSGGANCTFASANISTVFDAPISMLHLNYTFFNSTSLNYSFSEDNASVIYDRIVFSLCRQGGSVNLAVSANNITIASINALSIPACPTTSFFSFVTSALNTSKNVNINITCASCSASQYITLLHNAEQTGLDSTFRWMRKFYMHNESLSDFGSFYAFTEHFYNYDIAGQKKSSVICNATNITKAYNIYGYNASIQLFSINNIIFSKGLTYEAAPDYNFTFITFSNYDYVQINITFNNSRLYNISNQLGYTLSSRQLNLSGSYNISAFIRNPSSNISYSTYFFINDTQKPSLAIYPYPELTINIGTAINFSATAFDANLFAVNATLYYPNLSMAYSTEIKNIIPTEYSLNFTFAPPIEGIFNYSVIAADSHTANDITAMKIAGKDNEIIYNDKVKISAPQASILSTARQKDRYTLSAYYPKGIASKEFILESDCKLDYIENSRYTAHFVDWCNKLWIDFDGTGINPKIEMIADNSYRIIFETEKETLLFNSIGGINIMQVSSLIIVKQPPTPYDNEIIEGTSWFNSSALDVATTAGVLLYFLLFMIFVFLVCVSLYTGIPIMLIFSGLYGFFFSLLVYTKISAIIGAIFFAFSAIIIIISIVYIKD